MLCFGVAAAFSGCTTYPAQGTEPIPVVATVPPLGWLLEQVGGEAVAVQVLIPPGRSPHSFEPTPGDVQGLGRARFCLRVGHGAFGFEERLLAPLYRADRRPAGTPPVSIVRLDEVAKTVGISLAGDPHLWLAPPVLVDVAGRVAEALATVDPAGAAEYRRRGAVLQDTLKALDQRLAARLAASPCRTFLVDHPAWGNFADHYGLTQLALEVDGKSPGPASLVRLMGEAERAKIRLLLVEPGPPKRSAATVARTLGAEIETLDPLAPDVPANLERVVDLVTRSCAHD